MIAPASTRIVRPCADYIPSLALSPTKVLRLRRCRLRSPPLSPSTPFIGSFIYRREIHSPSPTTCRAEDAAVRARPWLASLTFPPPTHAVKSFLGFFPVNLPVRLDIWLISAVLMLLRELSPFVVSLYSSSVNLINPYLSQVQSNSSSGW